MKGKSLSRVRLLATPWTAAYQAPPSVGFSRQEYWSGVPLPFPHPMRIDINYKKKKKSVKTTNTWRLNNTFLKNERVTEEIKKEIKFLETNDSENKTTQNLWDAAKRVLRGKFIASRNKKNIKYTT